MNVLYDLYRTIASTITEGVLDIKKVDIDLGQLKKEGLALPVEFPLLLIRFQNIFWKEYSSTNQIGLVHIRLKLIYPFVEDDENYFADSNVRSEVETFYDLIQTVHDCVKDIVPGPSSWIKRFNENLLETDPLELKWIYCMDYYCNVFSDGTYFDSGVAVDVDYDLLANVSLVFERALGGKRVG
jgi:hypothetical protein